MVELATWKQYLDLILNHPETKKDIDFKDEYTIKETLKTVCIKYLMTAEQQYNDVYFPKLPKLESDNNELSLLVNDFIKNNNVFEDGSKVLRFSNFIKDVFTEQYNDIFEYFWVNSKELRDSIKPKKVVNYHGIKLNIETLAGDIRKGVNDDGEEWSREQVYHYGSIVNTISPDGEELDFFLNTKPVKNAPIFVIHQLDKVGMKFDEDKFMIGFKNKQAAINAYKESCHDFKNKFGGCTEYSIDDLKTLIFTNKNPDVIYTDDETYDEFVDDGIIDVTEIENLTEHFEMLNEKMFKKDNLNDIVMGFEAECYVTASYSAYAKQSAREEGDGTPSTTIDLKSVTSPSDIEEWVYTIQDYLDNVGEHTYSYRGIIDEKYKEWQLDGEDEHIKNFIKKDEKDIIRIFKESRTAAFKENDNNRYFRAYGGTYYPLDFDNITDNDSNMIEIIYLLLKKQNDSHMDIQYHIQRMFDTMYDKETFYKEYYKSLNQVMIDVITELDGSGSVYTNERGEYKLVIDTSQGTLEYWDDITQYDEDEEEEQSEHYHQHAPKIEKLTGYETIVSDGYHHTERRPDTYILEPDSSLDSSYDGLVPVEIISPPFELKTGLEQINKIFNYIQKNGNTNEATGLHINLSIRGKGYKDFNLLKLLVLSNDSHVLSSFDREKSRWAGSTVEKLRKTISTTLNKVIDLERIEIILNPLIDNYFTNEKYQSINLSRLKNSGYIEWRAAGGSGYHTKFSEVKRNIEQFAGAMEAACNPDYMKKEYYTKLFKLVDGIVNNQDTPTTNNDVIKYLKKFSSNIPFYKELYTLSSYINGVDLDSRYAHLGNMSREQTILQFSRLLYDVYKYTIKRGNKIPPKDLLAIRTIAKKLDITKDDFEMIERYSSMVLSFDIIQKILGIKELSDSHFIKVTNLLIENEKYSKVITGDLKKLIERKSGLSLEDYTKLLKEQQLNEKMFKKDNLTDIVMGFEAECYVSSTGELPDDYEPNAPNPQKEWVLSDISCESHLVDDIQGLFENVDDFDNYYEAFSEIKLSWMFDRKRIHSFIKDYDSIIKNTFLKSTDYLLGDENYVISLHDKKYLLNLSTMTNDNSEMIDIVIEMLSFTNENYTDVGGKIDELFEEYFSTNMPEQFDTMKDFFIFILKRMGNQYEYEKINGEHKLYISITDDILQYWDDIYSDNDEESTSIHYHEHAPVIQKLTGYKTIVSDGYHNTERQPDTYILEPDSSLDSDYNEMIPVEIISPPFELKTGLEQISKIFKYIEEKGDTNDACGLHINLSIKGKSYKDFNLLKLLVLSNDSHVLSSFNREKSNWAASVVDKLKRVISSNVQSVGDIQFIENTLNPLIDESLTNAKYQSINLSRLKNDGYIEWRAAGGSGYHTKFSEVKRNTEMFAGAMEAACNPEYLKKEYYTKLFKLVDGIVNKPTVSSDWTDSDYKKYIEKNKDKIPYYKELSVLNKFIGKAHLFNIVPFLTSNDRKDASGIFNSILNEIIIVSKKNEEYLTPTVKNALRSLFNKMNLNKDDIFKNVQNYTSYRQPEMPVKEINDIMGFEKELSDSHFIKATNLLTENEKYSQIVSDDLKNIIESNTGLSLQEYTKLLKEQKLTEKFSKKAHDWVKKRVDDLYPSKVKTKGLAFALAWEQYKNK